MTVKQLLEEWLELDVKVNVRHNTYRAHEANARLHLIPSLGRKKLVQLTPEDLERLFVRKLQEGLSPSTIGHIRTTIRCALTRAERRGYVGRNVARLVTPPPVHPEEVDVPPPAKVTEIMRKLFPERHWPAFMSATLLGLRSGEIRGLRWRDVDFAEGIVHVRNIVTRGQRGLALGPPKTAKSRRDIPLTPTLNEVLAEQRRRLEQDRMLAGDRWIEADFVFPTSVGTPMDAASLVHKFQRALERIGERKMRLHDLRHAFASYLVADGVELRLVQELLGHSQIHLTANLYSHVAPRTTAPALERLHALLGPGIPREETE